MKGVFPLPPLLKRNEELTDGGRTNEQDKSGAYQMTEILGCYVRRQDALEAARGALADLDRNNFSQYDERDSADEKGQWPFGEDAVVHAVAETGENYLVCVRTVPGAHKRHSEKQ